MWGTKHSVKILFIVTMGPIHHQDNQVFNAEALLCLITAVELILEIRLNGSLINQQAVSNSCHSGTNYSVRVFFYCWWWVFLDWEPLSEWMRTLLITLEQNHHLLYCKLYLVFNQSLILWIKEHCHVWFVCLIIKNKIYTCVL